MAMIVGCQFASWEFVEKNVTSVGVEDHFIGCAPFGDGGDRTMWLLLCDNFIEVTTDERGNLKLTRAFTSLNR